MTGPTHSHSNMDSSPERVAELCKAAAGTGPAAEEAVEELLYLHHARFFGFAKRKLGVDFAGKLEPDDLLQEAYAEVFRDIGKFEQRGDEAFYSWVTRIIEQRFIDGVRALRRKKRDVGREEASGEGGEDRSWSLCQQLTSGGPTASRVARREDAIAAMMACIARLGPDDRLVIDRIYLRGEHPARVGEEIGRSDDAVRRLAGRAMERLGELMGRASRYLSRS